MKEDELPDQIPTAEFHDPRIAMGKWLPRLESLDVPTPKTHAVLLNHDIDGPPEYDIENVMEAIEELGGKAFIRSDFKSAGLHIRAGSKISENQEEEAVKETIAEIMMQHIMMQMPLGKYLHFREWLDLSWYSNEHEVFHPEVRVFIREGDVVCHHPREDWSDKGKGAEEAYNKAVQKIEDDWENIIKPLAEQVAKEFNEDSYSVDFVCTTDGEWYCTDMALNALYERDGEWKNISHHPQECEQNLENKI